MLTRKIERDNERFVVALSEDKMRATVTDEKGVVVTISYNSGNFNVRLPNGLGKLGTVDGASRRPGPSDFALSRESS